MLHGEIPGSDAISSVTGLTNSDITRCWNSTRVRAYFKTIGIELDRLNGEVLTPIQLLLINQLLDFNDTRSDKKKIQDLRISTSTFAKWKADPGFQNYLAKRVEKLVGSNGDEVDRALFDAARSGDLQAIKYLNEYTGRYRQTTNDAVDVNYIIVKVQEIILHHIKDPKVLQAIGKELELLVARPAALSHTIPGTLVQDRGLPL
jgi:hypothetical protein